MPETDKLLGADGQLDESEFEKLSEGQKSMIRGLNALGISNKTILSLEAEMRAQQKQAAAAKASDSNK